MAESKPRAISRQPHGAAIQLLNQAALGYIVSAALNVALELGIADRLADGPRSAADLAKDARVTEDGLYRVLRALASAGIFEEHQARTFALNTPAGMLQQGPASLHDVGLWMTDPFHFRVYAEMLHSVTTGQPAVEKVTGMPVFEYFAREPKLSAVFNNAMTSWSVPTVAAALEAYDFSGIRRARGRRGRPRPRADRRSCASIRRCTACSSISSTSSPAPRRSSPPPEYAIVSRQFR